MTKSVNFALTFSGNSFFPMSFPGFMQAKIQKFSWLFTVTLKYNFKRKKRKMQILKIEK